VPDVSSFSLIERERDFSGGEHVGHHERRFLDFVVDWQSLYEAIRHVYDVLTPLWFDLDPKIFPSLDSAIDQLLGQAQGPLAGDRTAVYVCSLCGDLGCGALTVKIEIDSDFVFWREWGYQNDLEDRVSPVEVAALVDMKFDLSEYESVLENARRRLHGGIT
jgi:hypothetical protein